MVQLRIPGPTPCPPEVLEAMAWPMINHRGAEYHKIIQQVTEDMKKVFQTQNDVLLLTGSGTGGLEAAAVNMMSPGEKVLSVSIGVFGERWANIAKTFGAEVVSLNYEWGKAAKPEDIEKALKDNPEIKTVMVTHNETSTGVTNGLEAIAKVVKGSGRLLLVDAISGLSSIDLPVDKWGCDLVISGSQKGWMVPPGMAMVSVSKDAWKAWEKATMPRFYWDFGKARKSLEKGENPWTPAVSCVFALSVALKMILKEGLPNVFARHARIAETARKGVKEMGLELFADSRYASNTVTSVKFPEGIDGKQLRQIIKDDYNVVLSGGQQTLDGKIFRIGHLGYVNDEDIKEVLEAIRGALKKVGFAGK